MAFDLLSLLASDNYIIVNKDLIRVIGLEEAILFGELCSQYAHYKKENRLIDNMFYCSSEKIEDRIGLSEYQQRKALQSLKNAGIISIELKGLPATKHFIINENRLFEILQTSPKEIKGLDVKKFNSSNNINSNKEYNRKSLIGKNPIKDISKNQVPEIETFVKLYNELCPNLPKCIKHTESRDKAISKIVKKYSLEDIRTVFTKANDSEFLAGKNDRGWTASIDFILRDDKFVSILEGKYDGKQRSNVSSEEPLTEDRRANKKKFWEDVKNGKAEKF